MAGSTTRRQRILSRASVSAKWLDPVKSSRSSVRKPRGHNGRNCFPDQGQTEPGRQEEPPNQKQTVQSRTNQSRTNQRQTVQSQGRAGDFFDSVSPQKRGYPV